MPTRGRDMFRPVTLQVQENFKVETGRIWLQFITEDKFMPVSHNLWSVSSVSSYWLRNILVLFICHAVTLNKILSLIFFLYFLFFILFFLCFTGNLYLQKRWELSKFSAYQQKTNQTFLFLFMTSAVLMQMMVIAESAVITEKQNIS